MSRSILVKVCARGILVSLVLSAPLSAQTDLASAYPIGVFRFQLGTTGGATMSLVAVQANGANYTMVFLTADHTLYASGYTGSFSIGYGNLASPDLTIAVNPGMYEIAEHGPTGTEDMALLAVQVPLAAVVYNSLTSPVVTSITPIPVAVAPTPGTSGYTVQWVGYGFTADYPTAFGTQRTFLGQIVAIDPGQTETQNAHTYTQTEYDNHFTCSAYQSYGYSGESGSPTLYPAPGAFPVGTASGSIIGLYAEAHTPAGNPVCPGAVVDYYGLVFGAAEVSWIHTTAASLIATLNAPPTDAPVPAWAYGALGAGLLAIASRRVRKPA